MLMLLAQRLFWRVADTRKSPLNLTLFPEGSGGYAKLSFGTGVRGEDP